MNISFSIDIHGKSKIIRIVKGSRVKVILFLRDCFVSKGQTFTQNFDTLKAGSPFFFKDNDMWFKCADSVLRNDLTLAEKQFLTVLCRLQQKYGNKPFFHSDRKISDISGLTRRYIPSYRKKLADFGIIEVSKGKYKKYATVYFIPELSTKGTLQRQIGDIETPDRGRYVPSILDLKDKKENLKDSVSQKMRKNEDCYPQPISKLVKNYLKQLR